MKKIILTFIALVITFAGSAQITVQGTVQDGSSKSALAFVNIGIRGKNIGCISNSEGQFILKLPQENNNDTLTFSYVGYQEKSFLIKKLAAQGNNSIILDPITTTLQEVVVNAKDKWKKDKMGVTHYLGYQYEYTGYSKNVSYIQEIGQKIDLGAERVKVSSFNIFLANVTGDSAAFRINFYAFNGKQSGDRVYQREIFVKQVLRRGWLTVNLEDYNIWMSGSVMASIEFLRRSEDEKSFSPLYGGVMSNKGISYHRQVSLGNWEQEKSGTYSIYLETKRLIR
jgi:hypothetical protein